MTTLYSTDNGKTYTPNNNYGAHIRKVYDNNNNLIKTVYRNEYQQVYKTVYPDNTKEETEFDSTGKVTKETNKKGASEKITYDLNNNIQSVKLLTPTGRLSAELLLTYDSQKNIIKKQYLKKDIVVATEWFWYNNHGFLLHEKKQGTLDTKEFNKNFTLIN